MIDMGEPRHELGLRAEAAVAAWLAGEGWSILDRRWRVAAGELDLVCRDPAGVLVGIEVRARRTARTGAPLESLGPRGLARRRAALACYARAVRMPFAGLRLDLVTAAPDPAGGWRLSLHRAIDAW